MGFEVVQSSFSVAPSADPIDRQAKKMLADILANLSTMENLQKIDRINRGIKHAREVGRWTRKPPAGFYVEDKHLRVNVEEFLEIRDALLDHYYNQTPWSELENHTNVSRSTLSTIYNNEDRRRLFVYGEGWDQWDRDDAALEKAEPPENTDITHKEAALEDVNLKTYLSILEDAPDYIDPEEERARNERQRTVSGTEEAIISTISEALTHIQVGEESLSEEDLLEIHKQNRAAVSKRTSENN